MSIEKPLNKFELAALSDVLGYPLLLGLTGLSMEKIVAYQFGLPPRNLPKNQVPWNDIETKRLRFLQTLIKTLQGSYNNEGICQWFRRPRTQLDDKKPGELLYRTDWNPDDPEIQKLLELARSIDAGAS